MFSKSKKWKSVKIKEIGKVITGKTPSTTDPRNFGGRYPFITIPDLKNQRYIEKTERTLSEKGAQSMRNLKLPPKAVVVSCLATVGEVGITCRESFTNQQINSVICDIDKILPEFLYYCFKYVKPRLLKYSGSVYTNISKSKFENFEITIPQDLNEQKRIADILSAFDEKIELNNKINQTLEEMAQAIFEEWFVKFRFPGWEKVKFVDSELGKIPEGWRVERLGEIVERRRERIKTFEEWKREKLLDLGRFPRRSLSVSTFGKGAEIKTSAFRFYKGDILFGAVRPYFHKVVIAPFDGVTNQSVFVIYPRKRELYSFSISLLFSASTIEFASKCASGTKMPVVKWDDLCRMPFVLPPKKLLNHFEKMCFPLYKQLIRNVKENQLLSSLRDLLLPKLMSGEIRV